MTSLLAGSTARYIAEAIMTRQEAIDVSKWACKLSGRPDVRDRITRLSREAELGDRPWSDLSDYLLRSFPENPSLADGVFEG